MGKESCEAMKIHLLHFLLFAPSEQLSEQVVRGLHNRFPNLSLTLRKEPDAFLETLGSRRWDMVFLLPPLEDDFLQRLAEHLRTDGMTFPIVRLLPQPPDGEKARPLLPPRLITVATQRIDRFLDALNKVAFDGEAQQPPSHLHELLDFIDDGLFVLDVFGTLIYTNTAFAALSDKQPGDILGHNFAELTPPELLERARVTFEHVLSGRRIWSHVKVDTPRRRIIHMELFPIRRGDEVVAVGGMMRDVTAQEEAKLRERRYRHRRETQYIALTSLGTRPELAEGRWEASLGLLLDVAVQSLGVEGGEFWRLLEIDAETALFRCEATVGASEQKGALLRLPREQHLWSRLRRGQVIVMEGDEADQARLEANAIRLSRHRAVLIAPMLLRNKLIGFAIYFQGTPRRWFADEVAFVERLMAYFSQAHLTRELRQRNALLDAIAHLSREVIRGKDLDETLSIIARSVHRLTEAETVIVYASDAARRPHFVHIGAASMLGTGEDNDTIQARLVHSCNDECRRCKPWAIANLAEAEDKVIARWFRDNGWQALLVTPICVEGTAIGYILSAYHHPHHFDEDEQQTLTAVADQCGYAIDRIRILEAERRQRRWMEGLYIAGRQLESARETAQILQSIQDTAALLDFNLAGLMETHRETGERTITLNLTYRTEEGWHHLCCPHNLNAAAMLESIRQAKPALGRFRLLHLPAGHHLLGVDLASSDTADIFIAEVHRWEGNPTYLLLGGGPVARPAEIGEDEARFADMLADLVGTACERIHFFASLQAERDRLGVLHRLSQHLLESLDPREVAGQALEELCASTGASQGLVHLAQMRRAYGELLAVHNFPEEAVQRLKAFLRQDDGRGLTRWVMRTRKSVILDEVQKDERWVTIEGVDEGVNSLISVPLLGKGQVLGTLNLYSEEPHFFDQAHLRLVESTASTIAIALYNAHLFHQEQERRRFAEALEEAVAIVNSDLEFDEILSRILEQVERVIGGDTSNIMLLQKQEVRIVRWRGYEKFLGQVEVPIKPFPLRRYPSLLTMKEEGHSVCIPDTRHDPRWVIGKGDRWRRSYIGAPIRIAGVTVGFINVNSTRPNDFTEAHARRLEAFAEHAAIAIRNARLYRALQQYAGQLERRVEERTAELLAQYARLNAVLNSTTNGIIVTDAKGTIIQSNPVATRWLTQHFPPDKARLLRDKIREVATEAKRRPETIVEIDQVALHLRASPVHGTEDTPDARHVVIAIDDVSQLRALDRLKSRFISNISHELRTPLTSIKLYAQLLRRKWAQQAEEQEKEELTHYLDALEREVAHQEALIEEVLNFSRLDAGEARLALQRVDLAQMMHTICDEMQVMASARNLTLTCEGQGPLWCELDVPKIERVIRNLLVNAIRYTDGGGRVSVTVHPCFFANGEEAACLRVSDTGIGIPQIEAKHIFERFYRGEEAQRRQIPGTGLGLAIVKELVQLHRGLITVHSEVGKGTTFTVRLPLRQTELHTGKENY